MTYDQFRSAATKRGVRPLAPVAPLDNQLREIHSWDDHDEKIAALTRMVRDLAGFNLLDAPEWRETKLSPSEKHVMVFMIKREGRLCRREPLYEAAFDCKPKTLDVLMCKMRKKLDGLVEIKTVWGEGYTATRCPGVVFSWEQGAADGATRKA